MTSPAQTEDRPVRSLIPVRMDKMPWSRFHWMVIFGLGTAWILDGLEIQIVASAGYKADLGMSDAQVGFTATIYLIGQVVGALVFGRLTDKLGRKRLFVITLAVYLVGSAVAGLSPTVWFLYVFRFVAGMGIGGEYSAINSAIDELMPGKYRGRVDLAINGTYWAGAMLGAVASYVFLDTTRFSEGLGWRLAFFIGPVLGLVIIYMRRHIPESPRWLVTHGRGDEAERIVSDIEQSVRANGQEPPRLEESQGWWIKAHEGVTFKQLGYVFFKLYPTRTLLGLTLMITQSFLYNAIFFTSSLVLQGFYGKTSSSAALYFFPFAVGNLLGPLLLGRFFDTVGRRKMIGGSYSIAAVVLFISALLFKADLLSAGTHTLLLVPVVLLRLRRRLGRVPDGVGDLPAGGPRAGDLVLLLGRPAHRLARPADLRRADRWRDGTWPAVLGLRDGVGDHADRWSGGLQVRRRRRGQVVGGHRPAAQHVRRARQPAHQAAGLGVEGAC